MKFLRSHADICDLSPGDVAIITTILDCWMYNKLIQGFKNFSNSRLDECRGPIENQIIMVSKVVPESWHVLYLYVLVDDGRMGWIVVNNIQES